MKRIVLVMITALVICAGGFAEGDKGFTISGRVTDSSGKPLSGAAITVSGTYLGVHSDAEGTYALTGLQSGKHTLIVSYIGYETLSEEVAINGDLTLDFMLDEKPVETGDVLVSATRAGNNTPMAYSTVGSDQIRRKNAGYDMPSILSFSPAFVETSEAGNGIGYTGMRIRGTDGNRINVTIDGIPLNDAESQQVFWVDLPDMASSVDNIQIQRGAGTSSNGSGAFGATVSLQSLNPENEPFAEISSSAGSFRTMKNMVSAGTGMIADKFGLIMRYSDIRSDGYIERTGSKLRSENISAVYRTGRSLLKANIFLGEEHTRISWWGVPAEMLAIDRRYNPAGEYTDENGVTRYYSNESDNYRQNHFQLIFSQGLGEYLSLRAALHYTRGRGYYEEYREDQGYSDYGLQNITIGDSVISHTDLIRQKWLSNYFYGAVYSLKYHKGRFDATMGGGLNRYLGDHFGKIIWMQYAGNTVKDYQWYFNDARKDEASMYGKLNYAISGRVSVFGDLQYRYIFYKMNGIDDDLKDLDQEHRFGFFNPKAGLFWSVSPNQDAYLSFSVANREPTRADFKEASGDKQATPKPETLYDTELGYKIRTSKASLGVNIYGMIYHNQLVPTGELSDVGYSIMTNVKKSYRAGIELMAGYRPADMLEWNMNVALSRNRIINFVEYYTDYNTSDWTSEYLAKYLGEVDIAYSPSIIANSDLCLRVLKGTQMHLLSKYVAKQYVDNTMSRERMVDPYFVNSIRIDYAPVLKNVKGFQLQLLVNNIFNSMYISNGYGGNWYEDGVEKSWAYYFPQAGTNFMVRMDIKF